VLDPSEFDDEVAREWARFPLPDLTLDDVAGTRARLPAWIDRIAARPRSPQPHVEVDDAAIPSLDRAHEIPARIYRPNTAVNGRGVVYLHGGAFVMGDLDLFDESCRVWSHEGGCVLVSVDYRLAPEHPFPAALDDGYASLRWAAAHAADLSIDPRRLGVAGTSAGGALAAGLAQRCRDEGRPALAMQMLLYPLLDASTGASWVRTSTDDERRSMRQMLAIYLGDAWPDSPRYASPASCPSLAGLPRTIIVAAELDRLRDEAVDYAQRLQSAGVTTELHVWPRVPHDFEILVPDAAVARDSLRVQAGAIARCLG
jgi:acetyl esterase